MSPQREQHHQRQILCKIRLRQDGSPQWLCLPSYSRVSDENRAPVLRTASPMTRARPNARSLAQSERQARERQERERELPPTRKRKHTRPPRADPEGPLSKAQLGQRARREQERAEREVQENRMDVDGISANTFFKSLNAASPDICDRPLSVPVFSAAQFSLTAFTRPSGMLVSPASIVQVT
ncbi:hypothetical protein B0H17DRAFT_1134662 [Mycena rosella]|uniref:Uncharacterized protein n=1 Tax=Mycena rosella TaxID=1033263 RepID=A0AAD7GDT0_MYCRO|nr:hypothetical protein B0H17DRAFT_1134662 [Mycena rosella]